MTDLGLTLVDNPVTPSGVAPDSRGNATEEELVVLPEQLQRVGALLSTPEGKLTALCKGAYALLVGYPLWGLLITGLLSPSAIEKAFAGDDKGAIIDVCFNGGTLLAGPAALHALRLATRAQPDGFLRQLGAGSIHVVRSSLEKLEWWKHALRRICTVLVTLVAALVAAGVFFLGPSILPVYVPWVCFLAVWLTTLFVWWYSLKAASTLTAAPVAVTAHNARAEAKRMRESGEPMDPERWTELVEEPVLKLGRETMPTLSAGWGPSVLLVGGGLVLFALYWGIGLGGTFLSGGVGSGPTLVLQVLCVVMIGGFGVLPFVLAADPAGVSSSCARLEDDINALYAEDPGFVRALHILKHVQSLNKQQGLGFVVGGQVITKRTLWLVMTGVYGILVAFGPTLAGEVGLEGSCAGGAQHAACDFGWTFADDACFKLFGDGLMGVPLGWAAAEEACQEMGSQTHLASVTSEEQQRAVAHLAADRGWHVNVWIGLNDFAEEGSFVWSDDEPLEYTNWNDVWLNDQDHSKNAILQVSASNSGGWGDNPETNLWPYICAKKATPVVASGGEMNGCINGRWVMGTPYKQPRSLSTRLAPTIVYGMYKERIYEEIAARKVALNETITTAAECAAVVHRDYEAANAALYSNVGREECWAVFDAAGVIYDPVLQTCVFE